MIINTRAFYRLAAAALLGPLLASCASVSVKDSVARKGEGPRSKPERILVQPFAIENADAEESFARKEKGTLSTEAQRLLTEALVAELSESVAPARVLKPGVEPRSGEWVVSGKITRVAEGSRLLRMGLGLGFGGTKLETQVAVRARGNEPFLTFATTGGSNATPGAATNPIPFSSIPTAALHLNEGLTDDTRRTAGQITARIAQYLVGRGWLPPDQAPALKLAAD